jgi:hypothetical protein
MLDLTYSQEDMPPVDPKQPSRDDVFLTADELAERWRLEIPTLANMRSKGEGPPFLKLPSGSIRYRLADILASEAAGTTGFTWAMLREAVSHYPRLSAPDARELLTHLRRNMK